MPTRSGKATCTEHGSKKKPVISEFSDSELESGATFTPEPSTDPEPGTDPETDDNKTVSSASEEEDDAPIFAPDGDREPAVGRFLVLGVFSGRTRNRVINLMEDHGAKICDKKTSSKVTHVIMSDSIWHNHASSEAIRHYQKDNKENAEEYPDDPDRHRVWFLPLDWIDQSVKAKKLVPEAEHDYEKLELAKREARAEELAEERKQHGGKSMYARGERRKIEAQRMRDELNRQLDAENDNADEHTTDSSASSPVQSGRPGNPLAGYRYNQPLSHQSKLNEAFFRQSGQTLGGPVASTSANTTMGALATRSFGTGGASGPWSGVGGAGAGARAQNFINRARASGAGVGAQGSAPVRAAQPQPRSLGAIELSSGEDSADMSIVDAPATKRQKVQASSEDEYDW